MQTFREKLAAAMVGHQMADIAAVLIDALGEVLGDADKTVRAHLVEDACAKIARKATERK